MQKNGAMISRILYLIAAVLCILNTYWIKIAEMYLVAGILLLIGVVMEFVVGRKQGRPLKWLYFQIAFAVAFLAYMIYTLYFRY